MKRKLFCLLTLLLTVCSGAWADPTTISSDITIGPVTYANKTYSLTNGEYISGSWNGGSTAVTIAETSYSYGIKLESSTVLTFITSKAMNVEFRFTGSKLKIDNVATSAATENVLTINNLEAGTHTIKRNSGTTVLYAIIFTSAAPSGPVTLTGAWSAENQTIVKGATPATPTFSVTNSPAPAAEDYSITYSKKAGATDGVVTIPDGGASFTLNNTVIGSTTILATLTADDTENYADAEAAYEYAYTVRQAYAPTFSEEEGEISRGTKVTLTSSDGGTIYYTTDGTVPDNVGNGTEYDPEDGIVVNNNMPIKAVAYVNGYASALGQVNYTVAVPTLSGSFSPTSLAVAYGDAVSLPTYSVVASNSAVLDGSEYTVSMAVTGEAASNVTLNGGSTAIESISASAIGEAVVTATLTSTNTGNYTVPVATATYTLTINKKAHGLAYAVTSVTKETGADKFTNELTNPNSLSITYTSSDEAVATVDAAGEVTVVGIGTTTITATGDATSTVAGGSVSYTLNVVAPFVSGTLFSADVIATSTQSFSSGTTKITAAQATITNGEMYAVNGESSAKDLIAKQSTYYMFSMTNSTTAFKIDLNYALKEGDVITANTYSRTDAELGLFVTTATTRPGSCSTALSIDKVATAKYEALSPYTIQAGDGLVGATTIYIYRATGKTTYFDEFTITRPEPTHAPTITTQPVGASYNLNASATALTCEAEAYAEGALTYTWYSNTTGTADPENDASVGTGSSYTPSTTVGGTKYYYCVVSEAGNDDVATSNVVAVKVVDLGELIVTLQPATNPAKDVAATSYSKNEYTLSGITNYSNYGIFPYNFKGNGKVTISVPSHATVKSLKVYGFRNNDSGTATVTAGSGLSVVGSATLATRDVEGEPSVVLLAVDEPSAGASVSFSLSDQSRFKVEVYGSVESHVYADQSVTATKLYSTYCSAYDLDFSGVENLEAYVVSSLSGSSATITKVNKAPAGLGLILKKTANVGSATVYNIPVATTEVPSISGNKMVGVLSNTDMSTKTTDAYILKDGMFYLCSGGTLAANKAYLFDAAGDWSASPEGHAFTLDIDEGETTSLNEVRGLKADVRGEFYNLNGQRVAQPTKGLYIVNGRKVVIK